jgi:hypothetical protein
MWHTSRGDRTLVGPEAALVAAAIESMLDELTLELEEDLESDQNWRHAYGIAAFDELTSAQRLAMVRDVARYLLTPTPTVCPLTATAEATVAAIFTEICDSVGIEIDLATDEDMEGEPRFLFWRSMIHAAATSGILETAEVTDGDDLKGLDETTEQDSLPKIDCNDREWWFDVVNQLADTILWDRDFEMADCFLDSDPIEAQQRRLLLGIEEGYFTDVAPDPRPDEIEDLIRQTHEIVRAKPR